MKKIFSDHFNGIIIVIIINQLFYLAFPNFFPSCFSSTSNFILLLCVFDIYNLIKEWWINKNA